MTNDLVDDNTGIIKEYKVELSYIYVYYLDGTIERYDFSLEALQELNERMINQALYIIKHNTNKEVQKQKEADKWKLAATSGVMMLTASLFYDKYLIDTGNFNPINLIFEGVAILGMPLITKGYIDFMNRDREKNIKKYQTYLDNIHIYNKYCEDESTYDGVTFNGVLSINTIDKYTLGDLDKIDANIQRTRNNLRN